MKKIFGTVLLALCVTACGNKTQGEATEADSLTNDTTTAEAVAVDETATDETAANEATAAATEAEAGVLNEALMGGWSNNDDPNVYLSLSAEKKNREGHRGYGLLTASNEYYEIEFKLVITSIEPEGNAIHARYDKYEMAFEGDPDDLGGEGGEMVEEKVGTGSLLLVPVSANKLKIGSKEGRLRNVTLYKR